jgi:hypothetical protein
MTRKTNDVRRTRMIRMAANELKVRNELREGDAPRSVAFLFLMAASLAIHSLIFFRVFSRLSRFHLFLLLPAFVGCSSSTSPSSSPRPSVTAGQVGQATALFDSVVAQLASLPESIALDLAPPQVLLDSRSSGDGKDVQATITMPPNAELPIFNLLTVTSGNGRLQTLRVRPGDIVKYYAQADADTQQRLADSLGALWNKPNPTPDEQAIIDQAWANIDQRTVSYSAIDLVVAQVLSDNTLIIEKGLNGPSTFPMKMEIWRNTDQRMNEISTRLAAYVNRREPPRGWEPTPDEFALTQVVERLNQWLRSRPKSGEWAPPKLLESAPEAVRKLPELQVAALRDGMLQPWEGRLLQEALWLRDISQWARGTEATPLARATKLFDWTVRNLALVEPAAALPRRPWQLLIHGQATAAGRAWVFAELCRQQRLTPCVIEFPRGDDKPAWLWCGVFIDNQIYLFDPQRGLPLSDDGEASVATLADVVKNPAMLAKNGAEDSPSPITAETLVARKFYVVGDTLSLSQRAAALEQRMTGDNAVTLTAAIDTHAEQVAAASDGATVALWPHPWEVTAAQLELDVAGRKQEVLAILPYTWRPALWKARLLHFRGRKQAVGKNVQDALAEKQDDHQAAQLLYMNPTVRPSDQKLAAQGSDEKRGIYVSAKRAATYWLGLLQYEEGRYDRSASWLDNKILAGDAAATYNRERALEAERKAAAANP